MRDAAFIAGLALIAVGVGMVYVPAGVIVSGVLVAVVAYFSEQDEPTDETSTRD